MYNLLLDKDFWTHMTSYQAQINPEKVDDQFKKFKKAFYPHLEEYEERQSKERQKKLVNMVNEGTVLKFRPELTAKQELVEFRKKAIQEAKRFAPEPRKR